MSNYALLTGIDDKILDPEKLFREKLPQIKKFFVDFYGHEYQDLIEEKLSNIIFIPNMNATTLQRLLRHLSDDYATDLICNFLSDMKIEPNPENIQLFFGSSKLEYPNLIPLYKAIKHKKQAIAPYLNDYESLKNEFETEEKYHAFLDEADIILENVLRAYASFKDSYQEHYKIVSYADDIKRKLSSDYLIELLSYMDDLLSESDKEYIKKCQVDGILINPYKLSIYSTYINDKIAFPALVEAFSSANELILQDSKSNWKKDSIIIDRIKFFKKRGLDLGEDYESYLKYPEIDEYLPDRFWVDELVSKRIELLKYEELAYFKNIPYYQKMQTKINSENLTSDNQIVPFFIAKDPTCIIPTTKIINDKEVPYPIVIISFSGTFNHLDHNVIHELNHALEFFINNVNGENIVACGFDINENSNENFSVEDEAPRKYEKFNEIINELLAQDIQKLMVSNNFTIFNSPGDVKITHTTSYQSLRILVMNFYEHFMDIIIKSRIEGNLQILFEAVGKDNFEALNDVINEFDSYFKEYRLYGVYESIRENKETADTKYYFELISKSQEIYQNMLLFFDERKKVS